MLVRPDTFDGYLPVIAASETDLDKFKALTASMFRSVP
jgi:hypothetical protein